MAMTRAFLNYCLMNTDNAVTHKLMLFSLLLGCDSELFSCYGDSNDKGRLEDVNNLFGIFLLLLKGKNAPHIILLENILNSIHFDDQDLLSSTYSFSVLL